MVSIAGGIAKGTGKYKITLPLKNEKKALHKEPKCRPSAAVQGSKRPMSSAHTPTTGRRTLLENEEARDTGKPGKILPDDGPFS